MWGRKKTEKKSYDAASERPAIRCSICTGEQVAGFKDLRTGEFHSVMLLRSEADRADFCRQYGITGEVEKFY